MKYAITVNGTYKALAEIEISPKNWSGDQTFNGKITTDQFGVCNITDGEVLADGSLAGAGSLGSHDADFHAKIDGESISGQIKFGPFHMLSATFDGVQTT